MPTRRTEFIQIGASGCIEDRTFIGVEHGELNQVPGADLFFTIARDIANVADGVMIPSSLHLSQSVTDDATKIEKYTVHVDDQHGGKYGGCGFAKRLVDIATETTDDTYYKEIVTGAHLKPNEQERAAELKQGLARLATSGYFDMVDEPLIELAAQNGATVIEYTGIHTAQEATVDDSDQTTYGSQEANDPHSTNKPTFNVDTNHARNRAPEFDIDPKDAEILARILTVATVRVLSERKITQLTVI